MSETNDLVDRLEEYWREGPHARKRERELAIEAADEIRKLRSELHWLKMTTKPLELPVG